MPTMTEIAGHLEKIATTIGMRNCLIIVGMMLLGILYLGSRLSGWHQVAKCYPVFGSYQGKWIGRDLEVMEVRFNNIDSENAIHVGADRQGLYLSMGIMFRPFHPPIFVPWNDITGVGIKEVPWIKKMNLVKFIFELNPDIPVYVGIDTAREIEKLSEGRWEMPKLD